MTEQKHAVVSSATPSEPFAPSPRVPLLAAIDGPAGSGKSSVARAAAERLGFGILDTGAAYRALTWLALNQGVDIDDEAAVLALLDSWNYSITLLGDQRVTVILNDGETYVTEDVTAAIREPGISQQVSRVSRHPGVRDALNAEFRRYVVDSGLPGVVIEGRDVTTVIAPEAPVRILMTASPEVRAQRRAGELPGSNSEQVLAELLARDAKDALVVDFLRPAPGVNLVDTSELDFEQSVAAVMNIIRVTQANTAAGLTKETTA